MAIRLVLFLDLVIMRVWTVVGAATLLHAVLTRYALGHKNEEEDNHCVRQEDPVTIRLMMLSNIQPIVDISTSVQPVMSLSAGIADALSALYHMVDIIVTTVPFVCTLDMSMPAKVID